MDDKLLPCPFCGGEAILDHDRVYCEKCGVMQWGVNKSVAIAAWNKRQPDQSDHSCPKCGAKSISIPSLSKNYSMKMKCYRCGKILCEFTIMDIVRWWWANRGER